MIELLLVAAVGLVLAGVMFGDDGDSDSDSDDTPPMEEEPPVDTEGIELFYDGAQILEGTEGDDTLAAGQDAALTPPDQIDLGGGDDIAIVGQAISITLNGEEGDDTLTSTGVQNVLNGGAGDDALFGITAVDMNGGAGNDTITLDNDFDSNSDTARIDGGNGDDDIRIIADAGVNNPVNFTQVLGGAGNDDFALTLELVSSQEDFDVRDDILQGSIIAIEDFDPRNETLRIEIDPDEDNIDRQVSNILFEQEETDGEFNTEIAITFAATEDAFASVSTLTVRSADPFGIEAIEFAGLNMAQT